MPNDLELKYRYYDLSFDPKPNNLGDLSIETNKNAIKQSLINIFNTPKGSRIMMPDFGCDIHSYLFEPYDEITARAIATEVKNAFEYYEPRIRITRINANLDLNNDSQTYSLEVEYDIKDEGRDKIQLTLEKL